ncbi:hypothetical protein B0T26DRAFT_340122 [Lasiosphaeria miniovina]|uniref:Uncharacterized protein n=1 Tax=Lasiosphaeria miniovina TaxID=1954250 RepID=A0AA40AB07_9PEZI|nr:uncharacterized protein B0T26DRAFT_340122 [Lasiosphaeria miniovina]KAK0712574.1 hypothetical protein B0T26DRAFT_340122 [Lasiosphaeria miniovina]
MRLRSPIDFASRYLRDLELQLVPYQALWWWAWTPKIQRHERYQDGYFDGYGESEDGHVPPLDIRRAVKHPFWRKVYKALPYVDVVPVKRPWEEMSEEQQQQRKDFVINSTRFMYDEGKALYPRDTIRQIEDQLQAYKIKSDQQMARGKGKNKSKNSPVTRLLSHCEAPQTAWVKFTDFDGVVQHLGTWIPGATMHTSSGRVVRYGRSQVEFRTIQELTMPDPDNDREEFVACQWRPSVAYNAINVCKRNARSEMFTIYGEEDEQLDPDQLTERLEAYRANVAASAEWRAIAESLTESSEALKSVDKVVFFYSAGLSDDCDFCKRSMFILAMATRLRELILASRGAQSDHDHRPASDSHVDGTTITTQGNESIPIYMPEIDIERTWNPHETAVLAKAGVVLVESNGELFLKIDERTAVISYRHWNPVKQVVADLAVPAVMICKATRHNPSLDFAYREEDREGEIFQVPRVRARDLGNSIVATDPDSPRTRKLLDQYDKFELPELPGTEATKEAISFHVRRNNVSTEVEYW